MNREELIRETFCELCEDELAVEPYRFCLSCYRKWQVGYNEGMEQGKANRDKEIEAEIDKWWGEMDCKKINLEDEAEGRYVEVYDEDIEILKSRLKSGEKKE